MLIFIKMALEKKPHILTTELRTEVAKELLELLILQEMETLHHHSLFMRVMKY